MLSFRIFLCKDVGVFKAFHAIQVLNKLYSFQISKLNFLLDYMKPFQVWNFSLVKYFQNMIYLITKSLINRRFSSTLLVLTLFMHWKHVIAFKIRCCFADRLNIIISDMCIILWFWFFYWKKKHLLNLINFLAKYCIKDVPMV